MQVAGALLELLRDDSARRQAPEAAVARVAAAPMALVRRLLARHALGPSLLSAAERLGVAAGFPGELLEELREQRRATAASAMAQERALARIDAALAGGAYVLLKGLAFARELYDDVAERPSGDIDLLVAPAGRARALGALREAGFVPRDAPASHEQSLEGHGVWIDLHWGLLRPGRSRTDLVAPILARRERRAGVWAAGPVDSAIVMLVHNALTDHVTGRLLRAVDLDRLVRRVAVPWSEVAAEVRRAGLATAAWASLEWTRAALGTPVPPALAALSPGRARAAYLRAWLAADPAAVYERAPLLVRAGFSLALQDTPGDALRAIAVLRRLREESGRS